MVQEEINNKRSRRDEQETSKEPPKRKQKTIYLSESGRYIN